MATRRQLIDLCHDVLAPLIGADGGELYIVDAAEDALTLHLGGKCSGCPGASSTIRTLIEPAVRTLPGQVRLKVSVGARLPAGATKVEAGEGPSSEQPADADRASDVAS